MLTSLSSGFNRISPNLSLRAVYRARSGQLALVHCCVGLPAEHLSLYDRILSLMNRVGELGVILRTVIDQGLAALRRKVCKPTDLGASRLDPFLLTEESDVRPILFLLAIRPLAWVEHIESIAYGIDVMTGRETYLWVRQRQWLHRPAFLAGVMDVSGSGMRMN